MILPPAKTCSTGQIRCLHGPCVGRRDYCCPTRDGKCVGAQASVPIEAMNKTLVYANGGSLYSMNLASGGKRLLHRHGKSSCSIEFLWDSLVFRGSLLPLSSIFQPALSAVEVSKFNLSPIPLRSPGNTSITALTYDAGANMIFWTAGRTIFNMSLTANEGQGQRLGEIESLCSVVGMVLDYITGNFYIACKHSRVVVCNWRSSSVRMYCSKPITVAIRGIDWFAFNPNEGQAYQFLGTSHHEE